MRRSFVFSLVLAGLMAPLATLQAQTWPARPIRLLVPFPPGGISDIAARNLGKRMGDALGQPVVVENKTGASSNIAMQDVARAEPNGYTLVMTTNLIGSNPLLYKNLAWKPEDFVGVAMLFRSPLAVYVTKDVPATTFQAFIDYARQRPDQLNYGTTGVGSTPHMFAESIKRHAGISITHIPYKGSAPLQQDVMGGQVHMAMDSVPNALALQRSGHIKILAVASGERAEQLPSTPTLKELGFPIAASSWWGIHAPVGTPREIVNTLSATIRSISNAPDYRAQLTQMGVSPPEDLSPAQFAEFQKRDQASWKAIIEPLKLSMD